MDEEPTRRYLLNYLARPQWKGKSFDEISDRALLPETPEAFAALYTAEAQKIAEITAALDLIAATDAAIDRRVLDLLRHHGSRGQSAGSGGSPRSRSGGRGDGGGAGSGNRERAAFRLKLR